MTLSSTFSRWCMKSKVVKTNVDLWYARGQHARENAYFRNWLVCVNVCLTTDAYHHYALHVLTQMIQGGMFVVDNGATFPFKEFALQYVLPRCFWNESKEKYEQKWQRMTCPLWDRENEKWSSAMPCMVKVGTTQNREESTERCYSPFHVTLDSFASLNNHTLMLVFGPLFVSLPLSPRCRFFSYPLVSFLLSFFLYISQLWHIILYTWVDWLFYYYYGRQSHVKQLSYHNYHNNSYQKHQY